MCQWVPRYQSSEPFALKPGPEVAVKHKYWSFLNIALRACDQVVAPRDPHVTPVQTQTNFFSRANYWDLCLQHSRKLLYPSFVNGSQVGALSQLGLHTDTASPSFGHLLRTPSTWARYSQKRMASKTTAALRHVSPNLDAELQ